MEPRPETMDFEPNYLPFVEFYDEDAAVAVTPAAPDATSKRLRPWLALVVLAEGEFERPEGAVPDNSLPFVTVGDLTRVSTRRPTVGVGPRPREPDARGVCKRDSFRRRRGGAEPLRRRARRRIPTLRARG